MAETRATAVDIRQRLEDTYRCAVGVRLSGNTSLWSLRLTFSHMPHALEGLERNALFQAVGASLEGLNMAARALSLTIDFKSLPTPGTGQAGNTDCRTTDGVGETACRTA